MRQFRLECIALAKEPAETMWDGIADAAQALINVYAPGVSFRTPPGGWEYSSDDWHHWNTEFSANQWVESGTLLFAALVTLMLRLDADLAGFAAILYYRDAGGDWVECG
jgi:hypothetical protein